MMEVWTVKSSNRGFNLRFDDEIGDMNKLKSLGFVFWVEENIAWVQDEPVINISEDSKFLAIIASLGGEVMVSVMDKTITINL